VGVYLNSAVGTAFFIIFGARPGEVLFGKSGAIMSAFAVSSIPHHIGVWRFTTVGRFFLLIVIGAVMEIAFTKLTELQVRGWLG